MHGAVHGAAHVSATSEDSLLCSGHQVGSFEHRTRDLLQSSSVNVMVSWPEILE